MYCCVVLVRMGSTGQCHDRGVQGVWLIRRGADVANGTLAAACITVGGLWLGWLFLQSWTLAPHFKRRRLSVAHSSVLGTVLCYAAALCCRLLAWALLWDLATARHPVVRHALRFGEFDVAALGGDCAVIC